MRLVGDTKYIDENTGNKFLVYGVLLFGGPIMAILIGSARIPDEALVSLQGGRLLILPLALARCTPVDRL